jgi:protein required for attachment to host cells
MYRVCIALVDGSLARFLTLERTSDDSGIHEELVERTDLVGPSCSRPGERSAGPPAAPGHAGDRHSAYDVDRARQLPKPDADFARTAMAALRELIDDHPAARVIVCAGPRMLGALRACAPGLVPDGVTLDEYPRDLGRLPLVDVRAELTAHGLLPPRLTPPTATI